MGLAAIAGEVGKLFSEAENVPNLGTEIFKKDAEFLAGISELKTPKLIEGITEHLVKEGRPGSAEYMSMFSKSARLDKELNLITTGKFDAKKIEQSGFSVMVDTQKTTAEMIDNGQAVLTQDAREDLLGEANTLKYKLDQHIGKTVQKASEHYATELTHEKGLVERVQGVLGIKPEPYEIPITPDKAEMEKIEELYTLKYATKEEITQTFQRELNRMMKQRPAMIGLEGTSSTSRFIGEIARELGGNTNEAIDIDRARNIHRYMSGKGSAEELQIFPEFGKTIEKGIEQDFA